MIDPVGLMVSNASDFWQRKYYVATSTFQTGIAINADPTAIAATEGCLSIYNSASPTGDTNKNVIVMPLYIKMVATAPTDGTDFSLKLSTDIIERYSTGGTQLTVNSTFVHSDTEWARPTAVSEVYFGDLTLAAASSEKEVGEVQIRPASSAAGVVIGDEYLITFGNYIPTSWTTITAAVAKSMSKVVSPVSINTGASLIMQPFSTGATTSASFYVECGLLELFHDPKNS